MSFTLKDWSNYSYKEVKSMLEEYRSSYAIKEEDVNPQLVNSDEASE